MNRSIKHTYILLIICSLIIGCRETKYVPQGKYLLKKNTITIDGGDLEEESVAEIIRQKPNYKSFGLKIRLWTYNSVDSTKVAEKRLKKNLKLKKKNDKKLAHQKEVNQRRIDKARAQGKSHYTEKIVQYDTIDQKKFFREWLKYKAGEKPVVFDSILFNKSIEQLQVYLKNRGYYYGTTTATVEYQKNRKAIAHYSLVTGPQYIIDSVYVLCKNPVVEKAYRGFLVTEQDADLKGKAFDKDYLNDYRERVAKFMRDQKLYGFSSSHINFTADTTFKEPTDMKVALGIRFTDRMVRSPYNRDSLIAIKHKETYIRDVYFHICDTVYFKGNFRKTVQDMGLSLMDQSFIRTIDTFHYAQIKKRGSDELDPFRIATFQFNGEMSIDPDVLELQNYLEKSNPYKEYYVERSYTRLMQLGVFNSVKPVLIEVPGTNLLDVHYYLAPSQKQTFGFEPRATNSNGFLGVASSINYTNKNLFRGAEKMVFSISGGFESQPPIFDETLDGEKIKKAGRSFNTFEIGPSIKFEIPGLFPAKVTAFSKRQRPRTIISTAYNFQARTDFQRHVFQFNYLFKFFTGPTGKTQIIQSGLPFLSIIKFVRIEKSDAFQERLDLLNDIFLKNAYSNQLIWQDWKLTFEYNNKEKENKRKNLTVYSNSSFDLAGNTLSWFKSTQLVDTSTGQRTVFGVSYSQFARLDNELISGYTFTKKLSIHARLQAGAGLPYGNTKTSLPYDYSFFAGGANDNRGWRARALGPGSYKYYLDTNRTATQIGDIRLGGSTEFRFNLSPLFRGAVFMDAGNIWTVNEDNKRLGGQFSGNWFREIALSAGVGLRMDLEFFILRLDLGVPITNPALPAGARWVWQSRAPYIAEGKAVFGTDYAKFLPKPFTPNIHFGIGYPF